MQFDGGMIIYPIDQVSVAWHRVKKGEKHKEKKEQQSLSGQLVNMKKKEVASSPNKKKLAGSDE